MKYKNYGNLSNKYYCSNPTGSGSISCGSYEVNSMVGATGTGISDRLAGIIGFEIASQKDGYPIAAITQGQAIDACKSMGDGYHLITNNEWMSIARNIESVSANWSSGAVGQGLIFGGNTTQVNSMYSSACTYNESIYTNSGYMVYAGNDTYNLSSLRGTDCDSKRQLKLNNGEIIWDIVGSLHEHVNKANTYDGLFYGDGKISLSYYSMIDTQNYNFWCDGIQGCFPKLTEQERKKYGPSNNNYGILNGIGNIRYPIGDNSNILIRGSSINNYPYGGIYTMDLSSIYSDSSRSVGFRCSYMKN